MHKPCFIKDKKNTFKCNVNHFSNPLFKQKKNVFHKLKTSTPMLEKPHKCFLNTGSSHLSDAFTIYPIYKTKPFLKSNQTLAAFQPALVPGIRIS